ncbi:YecR family lipoprotein [Pinirhizobacter soli]|uniref:YecR family lipoprotein n=1 Tax=Pinirhizobacter soli TaxID=2786953 RepID=UPI003CE4FC12
MKSVIFVLCVSTLAGCATQKVWTPVGGSRADGVVRLAFEYGQFEKPQLSEAQALNTATQRCAAWGYQSAEAFGGSQQHCEQTGGMGCATWEVVKEYQCTGGTSRQ